MKRKIRTIRVHAAAGDRRRGRLFVDGVTYPCVLGRGGVVSNKREGDGGTPRGCLPLRGVFLRRDRGPRILTSLPCRIITAQDAWCDDITDRRYNRLIRRAPDAFAEERLSREDRLYNIIVPLGWNDGPTIRGRGSAIFWHIYRDKATPTAGCVAVAPDVFRKLLPRLSRHAVMIVR